MLHLVQLTQTSALPTDPDAMARLRARVCQTLEILAADPRVHGGVLAGGRGFTFVLERDDQDALDRFLQDLPIWGAMEDVRVTSLVSFASRLSYNTRPRAEAKG